jgi:hypothetical protein
MDKYASNYWIHLVVLLLVVVFSQSGIAAWRGKVVIQGIYMKPDGIQANDFAKSGWGLGGNVLYALPELYKIPAGVVGIEYINLQGNTIKDHANVGGVWIPFEQSTNQWYARLYFGPQIGGHGNGFLRPYAGVNLALILYGISTDVTIKDQYDPDKEIRENKYSDTRAVFGYDLTLGLDLNFNTWSIDGGVKYLKTFTLPEQLGESLVVVYPQYFQIFIGVGFPVFENGSD